MSVISTPQAAHAAIEIMTVATDRLPLLPLICELCEYTRKTRHESKEWALDYLSLTIDEARRRPDTDPADYILALLTLNLSRPDSRLEEEATRLINEAYRSLTNIVGGRTSGPSKIVGGRTTGPSKIAGGRTFGPSITDTIDALYISSTFCDYIDGFDNALIAATLSDMFPKIDTPDRSHRSATRLRAVAAQTLPFAS